MASSFVSGRACAPTPVAAIRRPERSIALRVSLCLEPEQRAYPRHLRRHSRGEKECPLPYRSIATEILADWRAAERDLEAANDVGERIRLQDEADRLRHEYQRLLREVARKGQPDLPPFQDPKADSSREQNR